uniref:Uncharacterized protein n=1 Tax=Amphora coffeiformis TaxID=265554 RepID=A0A7S3L649_9STRA|mmetsp:Transcript_11315/g.21575  ORF Transcript_11315/g.21575 Transcript_11315/m.21575 type:complete len:476 (+) Transcript_11315:109-1536(+)|eukprot:scaffold2353_cov167-Amphora_coffeaeformis.AAC.33
MASTMKLSIGFAALISLLSITPSASFTTQFGFLSTEAVFGAAKANKCPPTMRAKSGDFGSFGGQDNDEEGDSGEFNGESIDSGSGSWKTYNDFPMFITQCSLQSFLFLLKSMRDPHTVMWMENFTQPAIHLKKEPIPYGLPTGGADDSQLLNYHGMHALNTTLFPKWESYFSKLIEQPGEIFIIESSYKQFPDYELEINPVRLATRLLSVRAQVAREFVKDLEVISRMTNSTLESYKAALMNPKNDEDGRLVIERPNLMFLEMGAGHADFAPSPLRKGNFDLLMLLVTQEAVHRVLNDVERQKGPDVMGNRFLQNFYLSRLMSHFTGSQRYRRSEHFMAELLAMSPNLQVNKGETTLVNPAGIAEVIIRVREEVALEWKDMAQQVPEEHLEIQRLTLNQMLSGGTGTSFEDALRGNSNILPEANNAMKEVQKEAVPAGEKKKEAEIGPFDLLSLPPMSELWNDEGANMNAPGVFE